MNDFVFDPTNQEGSMTFEPIPAGEYTAEIIEAAITQPKSGNGHMLCLTWRICEGDYENRQIWQRLCYQHSKEQTQDIARRMLKDICVARAITQQVSDPEVFKFKPVRVRVNIETDKNGQYDPQNNIKRVRPLTEADNETQEAKSASTTTRPTVKAAPKPMAAGPGAAPWKTAKPAA
jgi:Protein of unknown function (DUF669)